MALNRRARRPNRRSSKLNDWVRALPGDMHLLGMRTLEGFGVIVDALAHKLIATSTLAATNKSSTQSKA